MPPRDKTDYLTGMCIVGGECPAVAKVGGPVIYGRRSR